MIQLQLQPVTTPTAKKSGWQSLRIPAPLALVLGDGTPPFPTPLFVHLPLPPCALQSSQPAPMQAQHERCPHLRAPPLRAQSQARSAPVITGFRARLFAELLRAPLLLPSKPQLLLLPARPPPLIAPAQPPLLTSASHSSQSRRLVRNRIPRPSQPALIVLLESLPLLRHLVLSPLPQPLHLARRQRDRPPP